MNSRSSLALRLRGGARDIVTPEMNRELRKMEVDMAETIEEVRAVNATIAERWEALQQKFNEEADTLAMNGFLEPNATESEFLPEIIEMLEEDPLFMLTRRNYSEESPFVNPCQKTREFMEKFANRTLKEVQDEMKQANRNR
jgi:hypothetical protein